MWRSRWPLAILVTLSEQDQMIDGLSNSGDGLDLEGSWHRLTGDDTFKRVFHQRRDVVRDDDPSVVARRIPRLQGHGL